MMKRCIWHRFGMDDRPRLRSFVLLLMVAFAAVLLSNGRMSAQQIDQSRYDMLLGMYVDERGFVDYEGFRSVAFEKYIASLANADPAKMGTYERLAFLINAYNACVIRMVIDHLPISSPRAVDGFFSEKRFLIAGEKLSLNDIKKRYIFPLSPAMAAFALSEGAKASPRLLRRAYRGKTIERQLKMNARHFMQDPTKNHVDRSSGVLSLSMLLKRHRPAIDMVFGSLRQFAMQNLSQEHALWISANSVEISFHAFDWTLNSQ